MLLLDILNAYAFLAMLPVLAFCARRYSEWPEQRASEMYVLAAAASLLAANETFIGVELALSVIDVLLLTGLVWLALTADRYWPMPSAAFQALACLAHLGKMWEPLSLSTGYQLLAQSSTYPTLILLAVGIRRQYRRAMQAAATCPVSSNFQGVARR